MGRNIIRVTKSKKNAMMEAKTYNASFKNRGIKRQAYVCPVSTGYVRSLTRKGYPVAKKNYAVCVKNK